MSACYALLRSLLRSGEAAPDRRNGAHNPPFRGGMACYAGAWAAGSSIGMGVAGRNTVTALRLVTVLVTVPVTAVGKS
jgi:hypothetical protein